MGLSPGEDGFCNSETRNDKRTAPRPKALFRREYYRNKDSPEIISWVRVPMKTNTLVRKLGTLEERVQ
jgi:hypothetical protein